MAPSIISSSASLSGFGSVSGCAKVSVDGHNKDAAA